MLKVRKLPLVSVEDVREALQYAVEVEHATIPAYMTALYSLKDGTNLQIAAILRDIIIEEMGHMALAANILLAIGGRPRLNDPSFVPSYPGQLPMHIGDRDGKVFEVPLAGFSKELVHDVFMHIEEPEDPINYPVRKAMLLGAAPEEEYNTIGEFYESIRRRLIELDRELGPKLFSGNPAWQVVGVPSDVFAVTSLKDACQAIDLIIRQGEGSKTKPYGNTGDTEIAHYYRFAEVWYGRALVPDTTVPEGFSYSGTPIPFDRTGVWPIVTNPTIEMYPPGTMVRLLADQFDFTYTSLLNALNEAFNGKPDTIGAAMGVMYSLKLQALKLMSTPVPGMGGVNATPIYRFLTS
jgi:hypothetical protein